MKFIKNILKLMRVKHYFKNVLVFLPLIFSMSLTNVDLLLRSLLGFAVFCFLASIIYIVNDIRDIEKDRRHSTKCNRPLASGAIQVRTAVLLAVLLGIVDIALLIWLGSIGGAIWVAVYFLINLGYSFGLKNIPIVDLLILASGFVIRVLFGGAVTEIPVSEWLILVMLTGALYMGMGKRRNEIKRETENTRAVNRFYSVDFLDKNMYLCIALTIVFYAMWCVNSETIDLFANPSLAIWSVVFVIIIFLRYGLIVEKDSDGDPVNVLFHDKMLLGLVALFGVYMLLTIYVPMPFLEVL